MLHLGSPRMAARLPARMKASNSVSIRMMGFSYYWMPCTSGYAQVYMVQKQTGATEGMTVRSGSARCACFQASSQKDVYFC